MLVKETITDATIERTARERMAEIGALLPTADEAEAQALRDEYAALDGSWISVRLIEMPDAIDEAAGIVLMQAAQQQETNGQTLRDKADGAMADLATFLALQSPTNAQTLAAVRLLCRIVRVLIRLQLRKFDAAD